MKSDNQMQNMPFEVARHLLVFLSFAAFLLVLLTHMISAVPQGATQIAIDSTETSGNTTGLIINTSGGTISTINITGVTQNIRWKAFVGQVSGTFSLDDADGSTIFDWTIASVGGEVYATTNDTSLIWTNIQCANTTLLELENTDLSHTSSDDNITATFDDTTHSEFFVGNVNITVNTCPTLNTYQNNVTQDTVFEEVVLSDSTDFSAGGNLIFATIMESDVTGFDGNSYDFQMIVPENGADGFTGQTAYYLYVELS